MDPISLQQLHPITFFEIHFKAAVVAFTCAAELCDSVPVPDLVPMLLHHSRVVRPCKLCAPLQGFVDDDEDDGNDESYDADRNRSLHGAAQHGHRQCALALIQLGADVNEINGIGGWTPLHTAVWYDQAEVAKVLVEAGADVHALNSHERTPLILARVCGHHRLIQLLEQGNNQ